MKKELIGFIICMLFIGVSVSSAVSVDTKSTISNNESDECRECNEVSDADLIRVERLLDRVEVYSKLLLVLSRYNPELKEISDELSNGISTLKGEIANDNYPIICEILYNILYRIEERDESFDDWIESTREYSLEWYIATSCSSIWWIMMIPIVEVSINISEILQCEWNIKN
jgi:hypothetical protein